MILTAERETVFEGQAEEKDPILHVLHRLHEVCISIFIIPKNLRAAELVQNQAELSPVFECVLSVQSLKKPEMGMNIWYHHLSKSLPHLGYF